ncbi:MAG: hypothetical protein IH589_01870 [Anaerolineales bacterium]|nr:hypothetical protein [Anaerolineales bacterium]
MNLRCIYCQTPFTLSRAEMLGAIVHMNEKNQNHYDAHCPRCRRANSISRQRMELFYPNWQEAAKQQASAPVIPAASPPADAMTKTEPITKAMRAEAGKSVSKAPAMKPTAKKQVAAVTKKPAAKKTSPAKPAAKKAPAKGRKK